MDDSDEDLALMSEILRPYYNLKIATNGLNALKIIKEKRKPDLIVLDVVMPKMDGFEVCRQIKSNPKTNDIPVIFITGLIEREQMIRGFQAKAQDYVTKPFYPQELLARIRTQLDLKLRNEELKKLNATLEKRVDSKTRQLREANQQLKKLNKALEKANQQLITLDRAKSKFIQIISHEIRTPLTGIMGFTELLQHSSNSKQFSEYLKALKESVLRLDRFAQKALFITNLMAGTLKPVLQNLYIKNIIDTILINFHNLINQKHLIIENTIHEFFTVKGDIDLTQIALYNVIDNAVKFSAPNHKIIIQSSNKNRIEIINTGSQFSDEALQYLFKLFSYGYEPVDQNFGLGLSVTKMIMDLQGGNVEAVNLSSAKACVRLYF